MLSALHPELSLRLVGFEVVSALGTVGLSAGATAALGTEGRWVILTTMFVGRVGPLAIAYATLRPVTRDLYEPGGLPVG